MKGLFPKAPICFRKSKFWWGHLIGNDAEQLIKTAKRLGVRKIVIGREGRPGQHVDLCGAPLDRAIKEAVRGDGNIQLLGKLPSGK